MEEHARGIEHVLMTESGQAEQRGAGPRSRIGLLSLEEGGAGLVDRLAGHLDDDSTGQRGGAIGGDEVGDQGVDGGEATQVDHER